MCAQSFARMRNQKSTHRHSPYKLLNTKIRHLSKQRILYIQFSALVKSNARMFNCGDNTHRDRLFRTILCLALNLPPLSKGGGLTAKQKPLLCCICLRYIRLFIHQTFLPSRRRDCLSCTNLSISTTISKRQ